MLEFRTQAMMALAIGDAILKNGASRPALVAKPDIKAVAVAMQSRLAAGRIIAP